MITFVDKILCNKQYMDIRTTKTLELPKSDVPVRLPAPRQVVFDPTATLAEVEPKKEDQSHAYNPGIMHTLLADTQEAFTGIPEDFTSGAGLQEAFTKQNRLRGVGLLLILVSIAVIIVYLIKHA